MWIESLQGRHILRNAYTGVLLGPLPRPPQKASPKYFGCIDVGLLLLGLLALGMFQLQYFGMHSLAVTLRQAVPEPLRGPPMKAGATYFGCIVIGLLFARLFFLHDHFVWIHP